MISIELAVKLKEAGLVWAMDTHDFFAIPDHNMHGRIFVLSDMMAHITYIQGWPVVTFHGTSEWALDYILTDDVVWMPTETQLRTALMQRLAQADDPRMYLACNGPDVTCEITFGGEAHQFKGSEVNDVLAEALLYIMAAMPENQS